MVIIDDDIVHDVKSHTSYIFGALLHWLLIEFDRIIESHKDNLLVKARRPEYPTFIWISPPLNVAFTNNAIRQKMDKVMKNTIDQHRGHILLRLKKVWEFNNHSYFNKAVTPLCLEAFWRSVDSAVQFWDQHLAPKSLGFLYLQHVAKQENDDNNSSTR